MDFISNQEAQIQAMLKKIGIASIDELFIHIPKEIKRSAPTEDDGLSEQELLAHMEKLSSKNTALQYESYLGGGAYQHYVPALVQAVTAKSEFLTAYTPYQAEASQGMLQLIFEFQTAICLLTGMDVSNASVYDGASACAEAMLMALRQNKGRNKILVAKTLNPQYQKVVEQYVVSHKTTIEYIPFLKDGSLDQRALLSMIDDNTAAVLIQSPNFLGNVEDLQALTQHLKQQGILSVLCANPLAYGVYASAGELGFDVAVGDTQPFGLPLQYGGPYVGYIACKKEFVRQLPGRIVGETVDTKGQRGFVLTLQAREQHIRREKATSNICTNQALAALASLVGMMWYGKKGVKELALTNFQRASYLREKLQHLEGIELLPQPAIFNEFVVRFPKSSEAVQSYFRNNHILPGIDLGWAYPELQDHLLVCVTELKTKEQLDYYVETAENMLAS